MRDDLHRGQQCLVASSESRVADGREGAGGKIRQAVIGRTTSALGVAVRLGSLLPHVGVGKLARSPGEIDAGRTTVRPAEPVLGEIDILGFACATMVHWS